MSEKGRGSSDKPRHPPRNLSPLPSHSPGSGDSLWVKLLIQVLASDGETGKGAPEEPTSTADSQQASTRHRVQRKQTKSSLKPVTNKKESAADNMEQEHTSSSVLFLSSPSHRADLYLHTENTERTFSLPFLFLSSRPFNYLLYLSELKMLF